MGQSLSDIRLAENEVIFRQANERVTKSIEETKTLATEEGQQVDVLDLDNIPLLFVCECAKHTCRKRINLTPKEYEACHQNKSQFLVAPGHNNPKIERVMRETKEYMIVQKYITPPDEAETLHPTD